MTANRDRDEDKVARLSERLGVSPDQVVCCQPLQGASAKEALLHLLDTLLPEGDQEAGEAVEPKIPSAGSASTALSRPEF